MGMKSCIITGPDRRDAQFVNRTDPGAGGGRVRLLLDVAVKLNSAFLQAHELDEILQGILVGVTAGEGLGFNRALLVTLDEEHRCLRGKYGVGPASSEEAGRIWAEISRKQLSLFDLLDGVRDPAGNFGHSRPLDELLRRIQVPVDMESHVLVRSLTERRSLLVTGGADPDAADVNSLLGVDEFVVAPLFTANEAYGVIVADNFVTRAPISQDDMEALELFAGLASLAVCKCEMCGMLEDKVRQLQALNEALEHHKDQLVELERFVTVGRMVDQLSHEVRNPLSTIGGMANLLAKKVTEPELQGYATSIVKQSARLEHVLQDVLDFPLIPESRPEPVLIAQIVEATLALARAELLRHHIDCRTEMPSPGPVVRIDRFLFQKALLNIVKNAVEAMPEQGTLTVCVSQEGGTVTIRVMDTGLGMPAGHLTRAEEPFFTTKVHGMGLGLSFARQIMDLHQGGLKIHRNECGGTTVTITLPASTDSSADPSAC